MDGQEGWRYDHCNWSLGWDLSPPVFSPDSQQLAYVARANGKQFVVVGRQEGRTYDRVKELSLVFSPDSQRMAYVARVFSRKWSFVKVGETHMVVVDRQEGSQYDSIVAHPEGGGVVFDSPNQLHYMARKGNAFYMVKERLA